MKSSRDFSITEWHHYIGQVPPAVTARRSEIASHVVNDLRGAPGRVDVVQKCLPSISTPRKWGPLKQYIGSGERGRVSPGAAAVRIKRLRVLEGKDG